MRALLIFFTLFLVHLSLVARCALVADPLFKDAVASVDNSVGFGTTSAKLLPTPTNGYAVYFYNHSSNFLISNIGGVNVNVRGFENCVKFNVIANPTRDTVVVAAITNLNRYLNLIVIPPAGMGGTTYTEPGIPVSNEPGLAFINNSTFVITYEGNTAVKRRSTSQTPPATKSIGMMSLSDLRFTKSFLYTNFEPQTGGSVSAVSGTGDWLTAWDDQGAKNVQAFYGSNLTPSTPQPFSVSPFDGSQLHTPSVSYPFVAYVGDSGILYVAKVSQTEVLDTYELASGSGPHLYSTKGATTDMTVLSYVRATNEICIRIKNVQYATFSKPTCWTESAGPVSGPSSLVLANGTIVVAYTADDMVTRRYLTQRFPSRCGDSVISPNEECDGEANCANCVCKPVAQRVPGGIACPANPTPVSQPVATPIAVPVATPVASIPTPSVIPLLQCYTLLNDTHVRGYFSFENLEKDVVQVPIGSTNRFAFQFPWSSRQDVGQPTTFAVGRTSYFPASSFAVTWEKQTVSWFLTKYQLGVNPSSTLYLCPQNVSVDVDVTVSKLPNATELEQIAGQIALELGVDSSRIIVTVSQSEGGVTITIAITGLDSLTSAVIAEKLVDVIKNNPAQLEDSFKEVLPISIKGESVRGKPDAVTGQRGELTSPDTPSLTPRTLADNAATILDAKLVVINLLVLVLYNLL